MIIVRRYEENVDINENTSGNQRRVPILDIDDATIDKLKCTQNIGILQIQKEIVLI